MTSTFNEFSGKTVIVTGAGSGIGRAIARQYSKFHARLIVADIDMDAARETVSLLPNEGVPMMLDVANPLSCQTLIATTIETYGRLDVLCNNAGTTGITSPTANLSIDDWKQVIDVNLNGAFYCARSAIPHLLDIGGGVIVNIASVMGYSGAAALAPYSASKHGLIGLTKSLALEYGASGIRCVAICPGLVDTDMTRSRALEKQASRSTERIPMAGGRAARPQEVASLARWLSSSEASYINGSCHLVDGGLMAGLAI